MKTVFLLLNIFTISCKLIAQAPSIEWAKCFGGTSNDLGKDVVQIGDGNYVICGRALSYDDDVVGNHNQSLDAWLLKVDTAGNILWSKCYGGSSDESAQSIKQTPDGGFIFAGYASSADGDVIGLHGLDDYWVVKIDSVGNIQWQKCLGGTRNDEAVDIILASDGGYTVTGNTDSYDGDVTGNHNHDHWVVKLDSLGNIQWQKALGSTGYDGAWSIINSGIGYLEIGDAGDNSGDVTGFHDSAMINAYSDAWVVWLSDSGNIVRQKCYGGTYLDGAVGGIKLSGENYFIAGGTNSNDGDISGLIGSNNMFLLKVDTLGNIIWQKCYGQDFEYPSSLTPTNDGGFVAAGVTVSNVCGFGNVDDYWLIKIDSAGNMEWSKCMGGFDDDAASSVKQTRDGGFIVVGYTTSSSGDVTGLHSLLTEDYWVVKLSPAPVGTAEDNSPLTDFSVRFDESGELLTGFYANGAEKTEIHIWDLMGRELFRKFLTINSGHNNIEIFPGVLSNGLYFVMINVNGSQLVKKVLK